MVPSAQNFGYRVGSQSFTIVPCITEVHGAFIRALTKENFYHIMSRTVGWDEELYQQKPRFPERYKMVQRNDEIIGFFCIREVADYLYLHTIQLIPIYRNQGYGSALLQNIENIARLKNLRPIQLSVFKEIPAARLYRRLGYTLIQQDEHRIWVEKVI